MTDEYGTFEHADHASPRREHGYCTDDMARLLVVTSREPEPGQSVADLAAKALRFVAEAQGPPATAEPPGLPGPLAGRLRCRGLLGPEPVGFGHRRRPQPRRGGAPTALAHFERGAQQRSPWPRAMAFAALGAHEVLVVRPRTVPLSTCSARRPKSWATRRRRCLVAVARTSP